MVLFSNYFGIYLLNQNWSFLNSSFKITLPVPINNTSSLVQYGYLESLLYKPRDEVIIEKLLEVSIKILVYLCDLKIFQHQMLQ